MPANIGTTIMSFVGTWGLPIVLLVVMVIVMILPQRKRDKQVKNMLESIKEGDHIRTIGGFYGKVVRVKEDFIVIELPPDNTRVTITKGAVSTVENAAVENDDLKDKK